MLHTQMHANLPMCNTLKFTQNSFNNNSILAYLFIAMLCDDNNNIISCLRVMFSVIIVSCGLIDINKSNMHHRYQQQCFVRLHGGYRITVRLQK